MSYVIMYNFADIFHRENNALETQSTENIYLPPKDYWLLII